MNDQEQHVITRARAEQLLNYGVRPIKLGCYISAAQHADAALAEVRVYNSVLAATPLAAAHAYLQARYGL